MPMNQGPPNLGSIVERHHNGRTGASLHYLTLYSIALGLETRQAFEFGVGGSSLAILAALRQTGGRLISCDPRDPSDTGIDRDPGSYENWTYLRMTSDEALPSVARESFDFVLHDGAHDYETVKRDLERIVPRIKRFGVLLVHDTEHETLGADMRRAVVEGLAGAPHSVTTLPYGYGLTVVRIEGGAGRGTVTTRWKKVGGDKRTKPASLSKA